MTSAAATRPAFRRRTILAAAIALSAVAGAARALPAPGPADLQVVDREAGQVLSPWSHHGRQFIAGEPGSRYALRVTNHTAGRILVVLSVDGVNVVTGETAGWGQDGYVLHPYQTYDVIGWRKSNQEVAAFAFAALPQSYAARTGRPGEVGVIGMAAFTERAAEPAPRPAAPPPTPIRPQWRYDPGATDAAARAAGPASAVPLPAPPPPPPPPPPAPALNIAPVEKPVPASPPEEKLGTAHGAREMSVVFDTTFIRATPSPQIVGEFEYDTYANLVARGVIPSSADGERRPRPFPSSANSERFVPDPPPEP